jgi:hypothetical protein
MPRRKARPAEPQRFQGGQAQQANTEGYLPGRHNCKSSPQRQSNRRGEREEAQPTASSPFGLPIIWAVNQ